VTVTTKPHYPVITATTPQKEYYKYACGCGAMDTEEGTIHEDACPSIQRPSNLVEQCVELYNQLNPVEKGEFMRLARDTD
jgi:hypothetical protein